MGRRRGRVFLAFGHEARQQGAQAVLEDLGGDIADIRIQFGLTDGMFATAKTDFEKNARDRIGESRSGILR
ncbi:hypothetical protein GCM10007866_11100 [Gluconobacter albidus]|uniref:Uncharacterized protein n=1 Tax=Gluconobacter albidus TaxID=318683 RepID=A0ABQ5WYW7_9PROT|nr:hypothetical protein AA3250_0801 [Gluconobacter albidus NBRC 3250]GLQ68659.1 hypothetical protein GCM10007866_11100 [Gluconobacter albidus]